LIRDLSSNLPLVNIIVNIVPLQLPCGEIQGAPLHSLRVNKIAKQMEIQTRINLIAKNKIIEAGVRLPAK